MQFLEKYKKIVDESNPTINENKTDIISAFKHYKIEGEPSEYLIEEYLSNLINESLTSGELEVNKVKRAKDHLLFDYFFNEKPLKSYLDSLEIIDRVTNLNSYITSFKDQEKWKQAISASLDLNLIIKRPKNHENLRQNYLRHYCVTKSAKFFQNEGFNIELENGKFLVSTNGLMKVCEDIETRMKLIGGKKFTEMLFIACYRNKLYDEKLGRFFLNRMVGYNREDPLPPFGYLLNLAAKYTFFKVTIDNPDLINYIFHSIIEKAEYLASIYNIQPYNFGQDWNIDNVTDSIREIALFDSIFSINQLKPSYVPKILNGLFSWVDAKEMESLFGANLNEVIGVINTILNLSNNIKPLTFKIEELNLNLSTNSLNRILETISIPGNLVNKDFHLPNDKPDFVFKSPLIKNGEEYILLNSSWRSPNFYEAIMSKLRNKNRNLDDKIGLVFEDYVKKELSNKGIKYLSGRYKAGKKEPECDLVIEDENNIVFIEIKKKALTSASRAGDDVKLIIDLSNSILDAHLQTGQHELFLKSNEYIEFENKEKIYFKERFVIRVALTLLDFGSFQDRVILSELFKILSNSNLNIENEEYKPKIKKISDKMSKLRDQCINLTDDDGFYMQMAYFNCFFLSLPQLLMLINESNDNKTFIQKLKSTMGITLGSHDFYYEYTRLNNMFKITSP